MESGGGRPHLRASGLGVWERRGREGSWGGEEGGGRRRRMFGSGGNNPFHLSSEIHT